MSTSNRSKAKLQRHLSLASALLNFGIQLPRQKDLHSTAFPRDSVVTVIGLFTKAQITFRAIIILCEQGLDRPATALSRSLFETLVNLTFLVRRSISLNIFNDSRTKPKTPWPLHGKVLIPEFRLALFNAWSILRDDKILTGWKRTPGLKRHGHRLKKRIDLLAKPYVDVIGISWEGKIKKANTCVGLDIANFAASLGSQFRRWHRTVYARDSAFVHQSDIPCYLERKRDGNFVPRLFTSPNEVSGVLIRSATLYLGCIEELNKRFRFGSEPNKTIKRFGRLLGHR